MRKNKEIVYRVDSPKPIRLGNIVNNVLDGKWILAPFQRPSVWDWSNQKLLLESLIEKIPVGQIYVWKYEHEPDKVKPVRGIDHIDYDIENVERLILDGQQRLTFIAYLWKKIDPDFKGLKYQIFYNLEQKKFIYNSSGKEDIVEGGYNINIHKFQDPNYSLAIKKLIQKKHPDNHAQLLKDDLLERIHSIFHAQEISVQTIEADIETKFTFQVYEYVNKSGVKLEEIDYIEAALFNIKPSLYQDMDSALSKLEKINYPINDNSDNIEYYFSKIFKRQTFIRCIIDELFHTSNPKDRLVKKTEKELQKDATTGTLGYIMDFDNQQYFNFKKRKLEELTESVLTKAFKNVYDAFKIFKDILTTDLHIKNPVGINPTFPIAVNALIRTHKDKINGEKAFRGKLIKWIILFHINNTYIGSQDAKIKDDCNISRKDKPFNLIFEKIAERLTEIKETPITTKDLILKPQIYHIETPQLLKGKVKDFLQHLHLFIAINNNAEDWHTVHRLINIERNELEKHHILPKNLAIELKIKSESYNHISNFARIKKSTNISIGKQEPKDYLKKIDSSESGGFAKKQQLVNQQIPDKKFWDIKDLESLIKFQKARVKLICETTNEILKKLDKGTWDDSVLKIDDIDLNEVAKSGESEIIEFKESALFPVDEEKDEKRFTNSSICKAICGMFNKRGGSIYLGIKNEPREVVGINKELELLKKSDPNKLPIELYQTKLQNILKSVFKKLFSTHLSFKRHDFPVKNGENKLVFEITVKECENKYVKFDHWRYSKSDGKWTLHENVCAVRTLERTDFITPGNKLS